MTSTNKPCVLNCKSTGPEGNTNLVILHGLFGDLNNWKAIATRLSDSYRVHCLDLRNHGDSPHAIGMTYAEMASDVAHTCKSLDIKNTHVIGHSMGGKTAMKLALDTTNLVNKLACIDIGPRRYGHHHNRILEGLQLLSSTTLDSRKQADRLLQDYEPEAGIRSFLLKNLKRTESKNYKLRLNINEIAAKYNDIAGAITSEHKFTGKVLFVKGAESEYLTEADRKPIAALFQYPSLKTIDGAGHWPHSEKPDVVYKVLSDFFADD